jgi:hypothetical protein
MHLSTFINRQVCSSIHMHPSAFDNWQVYSSIGESTNQFTFVNRRVYSSISESTHQFICADRCVYSSMGESMHKLTSVNQCVYSSIGASTHAFICMCPRSSLGESIRQFTCILIYRINCIFTELLWFTVYHAYWFNWLLFNRFRVCTRLGFVPVYRKRPYRVVYGANHHAGQLGKTGAPWSFVWDLCRF